LVDDGAADATASACDEGDGGWGREGFLVHDERERGEGGRRGEGERVASDGDS
jgi:hypothetical protein